MDAITPDFLRHSSVALDNEQISQAFTKFQNYDLIIIGDREWRSIDDNLQHIDEIVQNPYSCALINTAREKEAGKHWTIIVHHGPTGQIRFFDSYGETPDFYKIDTGDPSQRIHNGRSIYQTFGTNVCGHYCLAYVWLLEKGKNWTDLGITRVNDIRDERRREAATLRNDAKVLEFW